MRSHLCCLLLFVILFVRVHAEPARLALAGTIQLDSRLICWVFGRCASLLSAYVFRFNMRAPHALHIGQIRCASGDTTH